MAFKKLKLWFDKDLAEMLADKIVVHDNSFDKDGFVERISVGVEALELKGRVELIADELYEKVGGDYEGKIRVLREILGPENPAETGMFKEFYWIMPIAKFVEKYGINEYHVSLNMMLEITKRNTSEYAIRPLIEKWKEKLLSDLLALTAHKNFHIRRLCSEGVRPRLPWAQKLNEFINDPSPIIPILDALKDDSSKYVQKSVANAVNDILKDNPEIAQKLLAKWAIKPTNERRWIIKHAMRNALKNKEQWAENLL